MSVVSCFKCEYEFVIEKKRQSNGVVGCAGSKNSEGLGCNSLIKKECHNQYHRCKDCNDRTNMKVIKKKSVP